MPAGYRPALEKVLVLLRATIDYGREISVSFGRKYLPERLETTKDNQHDKQDSGTSHEGLGLLQKRGETP